MRRSFSPAPRSGRKKGTRKREPFVGWVESSRPTSCHLVGLEDSTHPTTPGPRSGRKKGTRKREQGAERRERRVQYGEERSRSPLGDPCPLFPDRPMYVWI